MTGASTASTSQVFALEFRYWQYKDTFLVSAHILLVLLVLFYHVFIDVQEHVGEYVHLVRLLRTLRWGVPLWQGNHTLPWTS